MNFLRKPYDKLSPETRRYVRNLFPGYILRWYAHHNTDVYIFSYPKCGRTWLRLMIGRAITLHFNLPLEEDVLLLNFKKRIHPDIPRIRVEHDDRPMLKRPDELLADKSKYKNKNIVFLVRDPRDVIISNYFEFKKRRHLFNTGQNDKQNDEPDINLGEFIRSDRGGIDTIIAYFNIWAVNRNVPKSFLLVRYEDLRSDPNKELEKTLRFLGLADIAVETIEKAVEFASFENMRRMEIDGTFQSTMLKPGDISDPDSYKTRKGKVKGYRDHLNVSEVNLLNQKINDSLSSYFGYNA